jgi:serine/threonine protein kinase
MNQTSPHTLTIFAEALECATEQEQAAYLARACAGDPELRASVEELLRAHQRAGRFLDGTAPTQRGDPLEEISCEKPGAVIGPYRLLEQIGEGGFGVVYMAQQSEPLKRLVALKIIKPGMDTRQTISRFEAERQVLALMDHPNIAKVLDAGTTSDVGQGPPDGLTHIHKRQAQPDLHIGRPYFVMELVKGTPITKYCDEHHLTIRQRLEMFIQVCQGVQHAHHKGVIHRDLKPSNLLVAEYDHQPIPKIIDFGVAKALNHLLADKTLFTQFGQLIGTLDYMSPEQAKLNQLDIDTRSDIYSLGVVLYELLTGTTPVDKRRFQAAAFDEALRIIAEEDPPTPSTRVSTSDTLPAVAASRRIEPDKLTSILRGDLDWIVMKALEKDRNRRYETAGSFAADLERYLVDQPVLARPPSTAYRLRKFSRRNRVALSAAAAIALALLVTVGVSAWQTWRATQAEIAAEGERNRAQAAEAKDVAYGQIPLIEARIRAQEFQQAFDLLKKVESVIPDDPRLEELRTGCSWVFTIESNPRGAVVSRKHPDDPEQAWERIGVTPINERRMARGVYQWKFEKPGYVTAENLKADHPPGISRMRAILRVDLDEVGAAPRDMIRVRPQGSGFFWGMSKSLIAIPPFWIDRFEVTNRRFQEFVAAQGYKRQEFWEHQIENGGEPLRWNEAMELFRDTTGMAGPATWANGTFPDGEDEFPVAGVSWYEAAAFAKFEGKQLPTIYHWNGATDRLVLAQAIIERSNFGSDGPARVGEYRGLSHCGAYDMAGNVKEWCFNSAGNGQRYLLGGAWDEQSYMFAMQDARLPIERGANMGFRCVKLLPGEDPPQDAFEESTLPQRDKDAERILSDREFDLVKGYFVYDKKQPLNAVSELKPESANWIHERVEIDATYGNESLFVNLYLPKNAAPPYQPVIYWPGATGFFQPAISSPTAEKVAFLIDSGRALVWPVFKGTYERRVEPRWEAEWKWEYAVQQVNDLCRSIDYLESRAADFNMSALGYYGYSWGAAHAARSLAIESRIKAAVLVDGGLPAPGSFEVSGSDPFAQKERDPIHYLRRITIPVLMLNGRYDITFPLEQSQKPMFERLGSEQKAYRLSDSSHVSELSAERIAETLGWFDRYLGPVQGQGQ